MGLQTFDEHIPYVNLQRILDTDGLVAQELCPTPRYATRVDAIIVTNLDTIAHVVVLEMQKGGLVTYLGSASIPAGQGTGGLPGLDLLVLALPASYQSLLVDVDDHVYGRLEVAASAGKGLHFTAFGGVV